MSSLTTFDGGERPTVAVLPVTLSYEQAEAESTPEQLTAWRQALQATAELLAPMPIGTVLVAPIMGMGFFLARGETDAAELWCTDWNDEDGLSWDAFTEKARDKHFAGEGWAQDLAVQLRTVLLTPRKSFERVPGLRVVMRPTLVADLCGEPVTLI